MSSPCRWRPPPRAAASAGADVERIRLHDLDIRYCTGCNWCHSTGVCKTEDDLPALVRRIAEADGVIFGTPSYFRRADEATQAVLDRVAGYFADNGQLRLPGLSVPQNESARGVKRAVVITACSLPEPLATFFGYSTGPVRELRNALGRWRNQDGGVALGVGGMAVAPVRRVGARQGHLARPPARRQDLTGILKLCRPSRHRPKSALRSPSRWSMSTASSCTTCARVRTLPPSDLARWCSSTDSWPPRGTGCHSCGRCSRVRLSRSTGLASA